MRHYSDVQQFCGDVAEPSRGRFHAPSDMMAFIEPSESRCRLHACFCEHSAIRVKNTFIQAFMIEEDGDEEEDDEVPMIAAKSCPVVAMSGGSPVSASSDDIESVDLPIRHNLVDCLSGATQEEQSSPTTPIVLLERSKPEISVGSVLHGSGYCKPCSWFWTPQGCSNGAECRNCHSCAKPAPPSPGRQQMTKQQMATCHGVDAPDLLDTHIVPLEVRTPELSVGSWTHGTGHCKPCAWFWRPQGCTNGSECRHCHLCLDGEVKARKKVNALAARKHRRRASRAAHQIVDGLRAEP